MQRRQLSALQIRLGERIRKLREEKQWSQEHFADRCELHRTYIGSVERGERNLTLSSIYVIASTLGITVAELLTGVEQKSKA